MPAHVTIFTNSNGLLGKQAWIDKASGELKSKPNTSLVNGTAVTVRAETAAELVRLIEGCKTNMALSLGVLLGVAPDATVAIAVDRKVKAHPNGALSRTRAHLGFPQGKPGWFLIDFDRRGMPAAVKARLKTAGGLWNGIVTELPGLAGAMRVRRLSTLAGLSANGVVFPDSGGEHIYVLVADASDIPRAIKALKQRLIVAGLGWVVISKDGKRLERTIADGAVGRPEGLVFEGAPQLAPPLVQVRPNCEIHDGAVVDTVVAIPDLDADEERLLGRIVSSLKAAVAGEAAATRGHYIRDIATQWSKRTGEAVDAIERRLTMQDEDWLPLDWQLETDDFGIVAVGDILADKAKFGGATCRDPIEPELGANKAVIFDDASGLFSNIHGGRKFQFGDRPDPKVVFADPPGVIRAVDGVAIAQAKMRSAITKFFDRAVIAAGEELEDRAAMQGAANVTSRAGRVFGEIEETAPNVFTETVPAIGETTAETAAAFSDLGVGKSRIAIEALAAQARLGDGMSVFGPGLPGTGMRTGFLVQDHKLAAEVANRCNALEPGMASVWYGTDADDPAAPGQQMCRRAPDMARWRKAGGDTASLCAGCPFNAASASPCGYISQSCATPVVVMAGPAALTHVPSRKLRRKLKMPMRDGTVKTIKLPPFDMIVVDETRVLELTGGFDIKAEIVAEALLAKPLRPPPGYVTRTGGWPARAWPELDDMTACIHGVVRRALGSLAPGTGRQLTFGELRAMATDEGEWQWLKRRLHELLVRLDPKIGKTTGTAFETALAPTAGWNAGLLMLAKMCEAALQSLEFEACDGDGTPFIDVVDGHGLLLHWRKELSPAFAGDTIPTLILDATADEELLKVFWPEHKVIAEGRAKLPAGVKVISVGDSLCPYRGWSPKLLGQNPTATARNDRRRADNNAARIAHLLDVLATAAKDEGGVGFIGPKAMVKELERRFEARGAGRPPKLVTGHFGAIRGQDRFCDVRVLVVWSRPAIPPGEVEQLASVLFGRKVQALAGKWYERGGVHVMRKGGCVTAPHGERHPDACAEKVRAQVSDAEVDQAIGRARAIRRSPSKPLLIIRGTAGPSSRLEIDELLPVDEILRFDAIDALAARGIWFDIFKRPKGALDLLAMALGVKKQVVRDLLRCGNSLRNIPMAVSTPEELFETKPEENGTGQLEKQNGWKSWRVKAKKKTRYWTEVQLCGPTTPDEAKAMLARENIRVACVECVTGQAGAVKGRRRKSPYTTPSFGP